MITQTGRAGSFRTKIRKHSLNTLQRLTGRGGRLFGSNHVTENHVGGNRIGGNHMGGNHIGGNHIGGNNTNSIGGSQWNRNHCVGSNHAGENHVGGNGVGGNPANANYVTKTLFWKIVPVETLLAAAL